MPWVAGGLAGEAAVERTVREVVEVACKGAGAAVGGEPGGAGSSGGPRVLVTGDQLVANSVRRCLEATRPDARVRVGGFFGLESALKRPDDLAFAGEWAYLDHLARESYDLVVGDPLLEQLAEAYGPEGEGCLRLWNCLIERCRARCMGVDACGGSCSGVRRAGKNRFGIEWFLWAPSA